MATDLIAPVRVNPILTHAEERRVSLDGLWDFRLDPSDKGLKQRWHRPGKVQGTQVRVPGCWQGQGIGTDDLDEIKDFRLRTRTLRATYKGTGWYARRFTIPADFKDARLRLCFGGAHPSAEVWLNGKRLGENHAPFVPFGFDVTRHARCGEENMVVARVHEANRMFGMCFNFQGNWSGLYRGVDLVAGGPALIERFWIHPDLDRRALRIRLRVDAPRALGSKPRFRVSVFSLGRAAAGPPEQVAEAAVAVEQPDCEFEVPVPDPKPWSPDAPNLYRVDGILSVGGATSDAQSERVGFVKLDTRGKHFLINGEPYYLRGTGDFLSCPETGCPDTDRDRWRRKLRALRDYGYNYVRCQSYVYGPEYYDVADEVGLLVQSEMGMLGAWAGHSIWHVYPWPPPHPAWRGKLKWQWDRVVMRDVNHPSAHLYCMSNELGVFGHQKTLFPRTAWQCQRDTKAIKPGAFVIWTDGGLNEDLPGEFVNDEANQDEKTAKPVIQHEFRWWSSFPDARLKEKYAGAVRPYAAELAEAAAREHGIEHMLVQAADASQKLQLLESKGKMEACRRDHPTLAGISHFNAMDANPSPQGVITEFYEHKLATAEEWRRTNGDTVLLCGLGFDDRVLVPGQPFKCELFVSDFSHPPLARPTLRWELVCGGKRLGDGVVSYEHQAFRTCQAGAIELTVPSVPRPAKAELVARVEEGGRSFENRWDLWIFPPTAALGEGIAVYGAPQYTWLKALKEQANLETLPAGKPPKAAGLLLSELLDRHLVAFMRAGGRVLLSAAEGLVRPYIDKMGLTVGQYFFTPPAQYPPYEDGQNGAIVLDHPALADFPHEGFGDLQFFRLMAESPPIELEPLGLNAGDPIIRVIHSYPVGRSLAYLVERVVGQGGFILCSLGLDPALPEARALLAGLCHYAAGERFAPGLEADEACLAAIVEGSSLT
jgi:hypothetical protein